METKAQLEYELAKIELEKRGLILEERKLRLESKELEVKRQLEQLVTVDLTEDDGKVKSESDYSSRSGYATLTRRMSSSEQLLDNTASDLTANNPGVEENETITIEKRTNSSEKNAQWNTVNNGNGKDDARKYTTQDPQGRPFGLAHASRDLQATKGARDLPSTLLGQSDVGAAKRKAGIKRARDSHNDNITRSRKASGEEVQTPGTRSGRRSPSKRRRESRAEQKPIQENSGEITEDERYKLIKRYTQLLFKHMQVCERQSNSDNSSEKKTGIVTRVRSNTPPGQTHESLSSLHADFADAIEKHAQEVTLRCALQAELYKFETALPIWSPKCKTLKSQEDRVTMLEAVFDSIANGTFDTDKDEDCCDMDECL